MRCAGRRKQSERRKGERKKGRKRKRKGKGCRKRGDQGTCREAIYHDLMDCVVSSSGSMQFTAKENALLPSASLSARESNDFRRKLIVCIDTCLEECGGSSATRRPLMLALDAAVENYLEKLSAAEIQASSGAEEEQ